MENKNSNEEDFQGNSWTCQCEILQGNLLGGLLADEDPAPGLGDFPPNGPYDFFGFRQPGHDLVNLQQQQQGGPGFPDGGNVANNL
jgi:hypothetical protein